MTTKTEEIKQIKDVLEDFFKLIANEETFVLGVNLFKNYIDKKEYIEFKNGIKNILIKVNKNSNLEKIINTIKNKPYYVSITNLSSGTYITYNRHDKKRL